MGFGRAWFPRLLVAHVSRVSMMRDNGTHIQLDVVSMAAKRRRWSFRSFPEITRCRGSWQTIDSVRLLFKFGSNHIALCRVVFEILTTKATDKEKLSHLGYTTGRNSYWLENVAQLLDAILTPGQRIERDLSYGRSCDRKNGLLPILQNVTVTDTRHRHSSHSSHLSPTLVTRVTDTRHRHRHRHQNRPHLWN